MRKPKLSTHSAHSIDDRRWAIGLLGIVEPGLLAHQRPQFVQVDGGAVGCIPFQVVMSHSHLPKVARMAEETFRSKLAPKSRSLYIPLQRA